MSRYSRFAEPGPRDRLNGDDVTGAVERLEQRGRELVAERRAVSRAIGNMTRETRAKLSELQVRLHRIDDELCTLRRGTA
jgi:hypothetical protein